MFSVGDRRAKLLEASMASATGGEPGDELPSTLLFAAVEKTLPERKVQMIRRRLFFLRGAVDTTAEDLVAAKRAREAVEQERCGSLKHAAADMTAADDVKRAREAAEQERCGSLKLADSAASSIHELKGRLSRFKGKMLEVTSNIASIKKFIEDQDMNEFILQMQEINETIRLCQQMMLLESTENSHFDPLPGDHCPNNGKESMITEEILSCLLDKALVMHSQEETSKESYDSSNLTDIPRNIQEIVSLLSAKGDSSKQPKNEGRLDTDKETYLKADISEDSPDHDEVTKRKGKRNCSNGTSNTSFLPHPSASITERRLQFANLLSKPRPKNKHYSSPQVHDSLPPLPPLELPPSHRRYSSSSSGGNSSIAYLLDLDDPEIDGVGGCASVTPWVGLATDEEEEGLMMEVAVRVADDPVARQILLNNNGGDLRDCATPIEVLLNFLIIFHGKEKDAGSCRVCMSDFKTEDRCLRLPCHHIFHMHCILEWLMVKRTCPVCRGDVSI